MKNRTSKRWLSWLLTVAMVLSLVPGAAFAATTPDDQPFAAGTGGCNSFRIPALVTLNDGTLVAAADARWDGTADSGNIDTFVVTSADNGVTWSEPTMVHYADSDKANFIDPALATDGSTVYLLTDLYPTGVALVNGDSKPSAEAAFNDDGTLRLKASGASSYNYYLSNGVIYDSNGAAVEGYTVDGKFNLVQDGAVVSNLFYSDAAYQVVPTTFLCLSKSEDGGETWSDYTLIDVKEDDERFCGVGPGRGLVTEDGRIIFACYESGVSSEYTSFIYSDDQGESWTRTANLANVSSEASLVEADGKLYAFTRTSSTDNDYVAYYYSADDGATWTYKTDSTINPNTSCEMNALTYSKTIDGKTAILLSCPTGEKSDGFLGIGADPGRNTGKIFVGLVNEDGTLDFSSIAATQVTSGTFQYSCMTELNDGSIGLLYENGDASIQYTNYAITELVGDVTIGSTGSEGGDSGDGETGGDNTGDGETGGETTTPEDTTVTDPDSDTGVTVTGPGLLSAIIKKLTGVLPWSGYTHAVSYDIELTDANGPYTDAATVKIPYNEADFEGCNSFIGSVDGESFEVAAPVDGYFTLKVPHFSTVTVSGRVATANIVGHADNTIPSIPNTNSWWGTTSDADSAGVGKSIERLVLGTNLTYILTLDDTSMTNVTWTVDDSTSDDYTTIATYTASGNVATVTAKGEGEILLTATDGNGQFIDEVVIKVVNTGGVTDGSLVTYYIDEVLDTVAWMNISKRDSSTSVLDMEVKEGDEIYLCMTTPAGGNFWVSDKYANSFVVMFFAKPSKTGYALTYMKSTGSNEQYAPLNDKTVTNTTFYSEYSKYEDSLGNTDYFQKLVQDKITAGFQGGMGWERYHRNLISANSYHGRDVGSFLTFRSRQLPTVTKEIVSVGGEAYYDGMLADVGDEIVYNLEVTQYATEEPITYTGDTATDTLTASSTHELGSWSEFLADTVVTADTTYPVEVKYTITENDLDIPISNTVTLNYTYKSEYSSGSFSGGDTAVAKLTASTFKPADLVMDFGMPVQVDYSKDYGKYALASAEAVNGTAAIANNVLTYTPASDSLLAEDTITMTNEQGAEYKIKVVPASNVMYEESFLTVGTGWTSKTDDTGAVDSAMTLDDIYGYTDAYNAFTQYSNGTYLEATGLTADNRKSGDLTVEFTGNTFDLIGECAPDTAMVYVSIWNEAGKAVKGAVVDTRFNDAKVNGGHLYQTPLAHIVLDAEGTYTAKIRSYFIAGNQEGDDNTYISTYSMYGNSAMASLYDVIDDLDADGLDMYEVEYVYFDAASPLTELTNSYISTYALGEDGNSILNADLLYNGTRSVIDGFRVYSDTYNDAYANNAFEYGANYVNISSEELVKAESTAGYIEFSLADQTYDQATYEQSGPNDEIYLRKGSAVVLSTSLAENTEVQVSVRAIDGDAYLNGTKITSGTEMYYKITVGANGVITMGNTGTDTTVTGMLAVANLKLKDSGVAFAMLTEDDYRIASTMMMAYAAGEEEQPEVTPEPEAPVVPDDDDDDKKTFVPDDIDLSMESIKLFGSKIVTLTVKTSTDVSYLMINGQKVTPINAQMVKWGLADEYIFMMGGSFDSDEDASFRVVAYDKNGVASKAYTEQG